MERIKHAIEKARQQAPGGATVRSQKAAVAPAPEAIDWISYQRTRVVPLQAARLEANRIIAYTKSSALGWAFDLLRTQVLSKMEENGWRTLAITSPTPEAGKTVLAINLAMSIAHHTTKTALLVDFDLRRPRVGAYLGLPMENALEEVLSGAAALEDALVNPALPHLVILPTNRPISHSTEVLSSPRVADLISELRDRYESRIVIFDLPPLLTSDDAIAVLPKIDCVLMVVANGMSTRREIEESLHHLPKDRLVGTVLNKAATEQQPYYY